MPEREVDSLLPQNTESSEAQEKLTPRQMKERAKASAEAEELPSHAEPDYPGGTVEPELPSLEADLPGQKRPEMVAQDDQGWSVL